MLSEHFKCSLSLPTGHIVGKMHMSSKCTQHVITGFQVHSPPVRMQVFSCRHSIFCLQIPPSSSHEKCCLARIRDVTLSQLVLGSEFTPRAQIRTLLAVVGQLFDFYPFRFI